MRQLRHALFFLTLAVASSAALAQNSGIRRQVIQKGDVSVPGREAVVAKVELDPGASSGRHAHPGDEISYVLEGEAEIRVDGEDPRRVKAGEAFVVRANAVHDALNVGSGTLRLVGVYVVDKGKPLASPAK